MNRHAVQIGKTENREEDKNEDILTRAISFCLFALLSAEVTVPCVTGKTEPR